MTNEKNERDIAAKIQEEQGNYADSRMGWDPDRCVGIGIGKARSRSRVVVWNDLPEGLLVGIACCVDFDAGTCGGVIGVGGVAGDADPSDEPEWGLEGSSSGMEEERRWWR